MSTFPSAILKYIRRNEKPWQPTNIPANIHMLPQQVYEENLHRSPTPEIVGGKNNSQILYFICFTCRTSWRFSLFFFWGGGVEYICGEHSVEDHYLHTNGKIFGGGVANFFWGGESPKNRPPGSPDLISKWWDSPKLVHFLVTCDMGTPCDWKQYMYYTNAIYMHSGHEATKCKCHGIISMGLWEEGIYSLVRVLIRTGI